MQSNPKRARLQASHVTNTDRYYRYRFSSRHMIFIFYDIDILMEHQNFHNQGDILTVYRVD